MRQSAIRSTLRGYPPPLPPNFTFPMFRTHLLQPTAKPKPELHSTLYPRPHDTSGKSDATSLAAATTLMPRFLTELEGASLNGWSLATPNKEQGALTIHYRKRRTWEHVHADAPDLGPSKSPSFDGVQRKLAHGGIPPSQSAGGPVHSIPFAAQRTKLRRFYVARHGRLRCAYAERTGAPMVPADAVLFLRAHAGPGVRVPTLAGVGIDVPLQSEGIQIVFAGGRCHGLPAPADEQLHALSSLLRRLAAAVAPAAGQPPCRVPIAASVALVVVPQQLIAVVCRHLLLPWSSPAGCQHPAFERKSFTGIRTCDRTTGSEQPQT